jgi:hypothetical protein
MVLATKKSTDLTCIESLNYMRFQGVELSVLKFNSIFREFMKAASIDYQSAQTKKGKALVYLAVTSAQVIYLERMEIDVKVMKGLAVELESRVTGNYC